MANISAIFLKITMSKGACDKWRKSPIKTLWDYGDWKEMNATAAVHLDEWKTTAVKPEFMTVEEYFEAASVSSRFFCCEYDDDIAAFFLADTLDKPTMLDIAVYIAALRGLENFKDDDPPSYIYSFPALSGGDPEALLQIRRGSSTFLSVYDDSPDVLYFVDEATEFVETLLEDDE